MLCCPARRPFSASSRLPGGTRRSSNRSAISNCRNLRRAAAAMFTNRLAGWPFERAAVSGHLNVLITSAIVTHRVTNVKHGYRCTRRDRERGLMAFRGFPHHRRLPDAGDARKEKDVRLRVGRAPQASPMRLCLRLGRLRGGGAVPQARRERADSQDLEQVAVVVRPEGTGGRNLG